MELFLIATAACELWHQLREPLLAFLERLS